MLSSIPLEILNKIQFYLDKTDLLELCLTCRYSYSTTLPILYSHLELSYHRHVRDLQSSKDQNVELARALTVSTKTLTLKSQANGNCWREMDLIQLLGPHSPVEKLTFSGFNKLSIQNVHEIASAFSNLKHLEFKYCHIIHQGKARHVSIYDLSPNHNSNNNNNSNSKAKRNPSCVTMLSLIWSDFTAPAIDGILSYHQLAIIHFGANHNRYDRINNHLIRSLQTRCSHIQNLTISMPLVDESTIIDTVRQYGNQLKYLSLRCDSPALIQAIADHCHHLEHLALRGTVHHGKQTHEPLLSLIGRCQSLKSLELMSFAIQDIPNVLWQSLANINETRQKALEALEHVRILQKQQELEFDNAPHEQQPRRASPSGRIYHYAITEELLAQRHYFNQSNNVNQPTVHRTDLKLSFPYTLI